MTKLFQLAGLGLALTAVFAGTASAHMPKTITIRHQSHGCHAWSFVNGPYKASLKVTVDRDTSLKVVNIDVMPHRLVQVAGPKAMLMTPNMNHMSAQAWVSFRQRGVYTFRTKAGEDYKDMRGMTTTIGKDYVLRLTVVVK
jgi:hypothetical protein